MRIAIVAPFPIRNLYPEHCIFTKRGQEHPASWIVNLARALAKRPDIELHLLTVKSHLAADAHFFADGVHFHVLRGTRNTVQPLTLYEQDRRTLIRELQQIQPDIIESFGTEGPFSYAGVTSTYPCVIKIQGIITRNLREMGFHPTRYLWWRYFITQFIERRTFRLCTDAIADNDFMADFVRKTNPDIRIHCLPNLIAPVFFQAKQDWTKPRDSILFIGSLKREKGIFDLVEAFSHVRASGVQANLRIIGTGDADSTRTIQDMARQRGVEDTIQFLGHLNHQQIVSEMQQTAFLVHPAWVDFSPNSVYESMTAGLSVIGTKVGGLPYMIIEGETGYLTEPRNPFALATCIKSLLANNTAQQQMGTNAMHKMRTRFEESRIVESLISIYKNMIARQKPR